MSEIDAETKHYEMEIPTSKPTQQLQQERIHSYNDSLDEEDFNEDPETLMQFSETSRRSLIMKRAKSYGSQTIGKSLQQEQNDLEQSNIDSVMYAIRKRSSWRVLNLVFITTLLISGFFYIYKYLQEYNGQQVIPSEANIFLEVTSCKITIIDQFQLTELRNTTHTNGSFNNPGLLLFYSIPGRFNLDTQGAKSTMSQQVNGSNYNFQFHNILSAESCMIEIHVPQATLINKLNINCHVNCYIMMLTKNLTFNSVKITSNDYVEFNAPVLHSKKVIFQATRGRFQTMFLDFEQFADIRLQNGDIAIQTPKEIMLNFTHANPNFCLGSPFVLNPIVIGCQQPSTAQVNAYISGGGVAGGQNSHLVTKKNSSGSNNNQSNQSNVGSREKTKEKFFNDDAANTGNILLHPGFKTFGRSKEFQLDVNPAFSLSGQNNSNFSSNGSNQTSNILISKTNEQILQTVLLFQPNCFGNFIMCQTAECLTLIAGLKKIHDLPLNITTNSSDGATSNSTNTTQTSPVDESYAAENLAETELPHQTTKGIPFLNLTGRFGNLYVNLITKINDPIQLNDTIIHGSSYANQSINFDIPSRQLLNQYFQKVGDPHNPDPTFILYIGAKISQSDNFQQWQVSFNPAYAYFKPWWIGTFTFTLMSTTTYGLNLELAPGFCPFYPKLNLNNIYKTRFLIDSYFIMDEAKRRITTIAWQQNVSFPVVNYQSPFDGVRKVITQSNQQYEDWIQVEKFNETSLQLIQIDLDQSQATKFALIVSFLISIFVACIMTVIIVYAINVVYLQIIIQVASTGNYSVIEKKDEKSNKQPLMKYLPETNKDYNEEIDVPDNQKQEPVQPVQDSEISLTYNPVRLFYQLFVMAPPLSAFVDYLCVYLSKKYINSAREFYKHLFKQVEKGSESDAELHDLTTESMLGNDLKTLYEKFCYLNGYLEQKLDDEDNVGILERRGFVIQIKEDAQTESYVNVMLNGKMPKISAVSTKNSLQLFVDSCCKLSQFEEDNIVVTTFNEQYEQFITLNHLEKYSASAAELSKLFNITSKYIHQQWVVRDDTDELQQISTSSPTDVPEEKTCVQRFEARIKSLCAKLTPRVYNYIIDRQKMQNHFSLLLNHPEDIATKQESALANRELILFEGWYIVDSITVVAHLLSIVIFIIPVFAFTLIERVLYSPFSLIPQQYLLTKEDILDNYWLLPFKLNDESMQIKLVLYLLIVYVIYSIIDLLYYYMSMSFPQENFFRKVSPKSVTYVSKFFRGAMWILVLISAFFLFMYITLAAVWLMLGAILNPTAFLPYATAAATFLTVITAKAAQFKEQAQTGFQKIIDYVKKVSAGQMGEMMKKINLQGKVDAVMDSSALKSIAAQAAVLGLVDAVTLKHLQDNADEMVKNPLKAAENTAGELAKIATDLPAFARMVIDKMEEKAIELIQKQISKQIPSLKPHLSGIVLAIFIKDTYSFKNNLSLLIYAAKQQFTNVPELQQMGPAIIDLIFNFAYPSGQQATFEDHLQMYLQATVDCVAGLIQQKFTLLNIENIDEKHLNTVLNSSIKLYRNVSLNNKNAVFENFSELLSNLDDPEIFPAIKELKKYSQLLKVAMSLFQEEGVSFHNIFKIVKEFLTSNQLMIQCKDLLRIIELLVNIFRKQQKMIPTKAIRFKTKTAMEFLINQTLDKQLNLNIPGDEIKMFNNTSMIAMFFNFLQGNFENIPKDMLGDVLRSTLNDSNKIKKMVVSDKEFKKMSTLMGGVLEMVSLFMEDHQELTNSLHSSAIAFQMEENKASLLNEVLSLKYLPFTSYEGSSQEYEAFNKFENNPLVAQISEKIRLTPKVVSGIVRILMNYHSHSTTNDLIYMISKVNKCDPMKVRQFFTILILYTSKNQTHLANAAISLSIPRDYIPLILLSKRALDPIYVSDQSLAYLGAVESLKTKRSDLSEKDYKSWLDNLADEISIYKKNLISGGNTSNLKIYLLQTLYQKDGLINKETVMTILKAIGNNQNQFAKLTQNEIDLLQRILTLKNIDIFSNTLALSSETKQAVYEFASILNIDKMLFEDLVNIIFLANPDRVVQSIQNIAPTQTESFISTSIENTKAAVSYLEFVFSHQEKITKKRNFVKNRFGELFSIKLPNSIVMKLLFNQDQQIDINSLYQSAFLVIGRNGQVQLHQETLRVLYKVLAFITSTLNSSNLDSLKNQLAIQDKQGRPKTISDGQATLISMLNEKSQTRAVTLFLDYIKSMTKRYQYDYSRPLPEVIHLFCVLYLFFTGKQSNLKITIEEEWRKPSREVSIIEYLSSQMDIKPEFFESLHTFFLKDNQSFTNIMVKYMRRVQACDYEQKNPGVKIPLQSLVKIPDQFVLNFINLITGEPYSTSFFSKELNLNQTLVDFISIIMKIQNCAETVDISQSLALLSNQNSQVNQLLSSLTVSGNELQILILLMVQDYNPLNIQNILQGLNLVDKIDEPVLRQLLAMDQVIKVDGDIKISYQKISNFLKDNQLVKEMIKQDTTDDVIIAKALIQGQFGSTKAFLKSNWKHLQYPDCARKSQLNYSQLMVGIIGAISGDVHADFNVNKFTRDLYQKLKVKKNDNLKFLQPSNKVEYAYYLLARHLQLNPWIMMLTQGISSAWVALQQIYSTIQDTENHFLNPILVIQAILTIQSLPPLMKELFTEQEWIERVNGCKNDRKFQSYIELCYDEVDPYFATEMKEGVQKVKNQTFRSLLETKNQMRDTANAVGMNPNIFELITFEDKDIASTMKVAILIILKERDTFKDDDGQYQKIANLMENKDSPSNKTQKMSYQEAVESLFKDKVVQQQYMDMLPFFHETIIKRVYSEVQTLNLDPRGQNKDEMFSDDNFEDQLSFQYFSASKTPYFNMGLCTTFSILRKAYWECGQNTPRGDEDHQKIVATHLDYVFTTIERFYHFRGFMDFFSKARAFQLVGIAVGFTFTAENLINANCNAPFVSYKRANELYEMINKRKDKDSCFIETLALEKQKWKWNFMFSMLQSRNSSCQFENKYFKSFMIDSMSESQSPYADIENEPENFIQNSVQIEGIFNLGDYMYDIGIVTQSTIFNNCAFYNDKDIDGLKREQKDPQKSLRVDLIEQEGKYQVYNLDYNLTPTFKNMIDVRSGLPLEQVFESQDKWVFFSKKENFQLLIDIFKGNYESLLQPDSYFTQEKYLSSVHVIFGILGLSGSFYKVQRGWRMNKSTDLSHFLNSCCWNTLSNKKNMAEILSIYFRCYEGMPALATITQTDQGLLDSFMQISCKLANSDEQQKGFLGVVISKLQLSSNDQEVLINLIKTYLGDHSQYYSLATYSKLFEPQLIGNYGILNNYMDLRLLNSDFMQFDSPSFLAKSPEQEQLIYSPIQLPVSTFKLRHDQTKGKKKGKKTTKKNSIHPTLNFKKETKQKEVDPDNSTNRYFNGKKILNKIIYSLDQSLMHKIDKIDNERFNFINHSNLSIDKEQNDEQFKIVLWQLACSLTRDTFDESLALPLISEAKFQKKFTHEKKDQKQDKNVEEYKSKIEQVEAYLHILTDLMNDDYSFFFQDSKFVRKALHDLTLIQEDGDGDVKFMRSLIGLKSDKISILKNHINLAKKQKIEMNPDCHDEQKKYVSPDMNDQIENLFQSNILKFSLKDDIDSLECQDISKNVAQLFLGLSSGNINKIVESLMGSDGTSASIMLSLNLWKNINNIFSCMDILGTDQVKDEILPSIVILPLLIFNQINEQQDKVNNQPRNNNNQKSIFQDSMNTLQRMIAKTKPSEQTYKKIQEISQQNSNKKFCWNIWIESMDKFESMLDSYFTGDMELEAYNEIKYILNFMTGKFIIDQFKQNDFLKYILEYYQSGNDLINNPENLIKKNQIDSKQIAQYVPSITKVIQNYFPAQNQSSIEVFDKFIQLFIFVQVPASTLLYLENAALIQDDTVLQQHNVKQVVSLEEGRDVDSAQEKILKQLFLKVLKSTIDSIMSQTNLAIPSKQATAPPPSKDNNQNLIYAVMELLTGYDISESKSITESSVEKKLVILCSIVDESLLQKLKLTEYMNTTVIKQFIGILKSLTESPIKMISNPEFMVLIIKLIYLISGQENKDNDDADQSPGRLNAKNAQTSKFSTLTPIRKPLVELPIDLVKTIFKLSLGKIECVLDLLKFLKINDGQIKIVENIIKQVSDMGVFGGKYTINEQVPVVQSQETKDLIKKIEEGKASPEDMFKTIDVDKSGTISRSEYNTFARRLGMNLSQHRINEIFASFKSGDNVNDSLNQAEFVKSMQYLQKKNTNMALDYLGISPAFLTISLVILAIILVLVFTFIFLGIQAFSVGGTFGAIINSILPMVSGGALSAKDVVQDDESKQDSIADSVTKSQKIIQSNQM